MAPQPTGPGKPSTLSVNPPPDIVTSSSGNTLTPDVQIEPRQYKTATYTTQPTDFTPQGYVGQGLVDSNANISRGQYSEGEAYAELARFKSPGERKALLNILYSKGLYTGNAQPSGTGFSNADINAMQQFLLYANAKGRTVDAALPLFMSEVGNSSGTSVTSFRPTSNQDIKAVFNQAAGNVLGRQLSDAELQKFIKSYHAQEAGQAAGGSMAPSLQTAATEAARAASPDEANAMGALQLTNVFDNMIKGLG